MRMYFVLLAMLCFGGAVHAQTEYDIRPGDSYKQVLEQLNNSLDAATLTIAKRREVITASSALTPGTVIQYDFKAKEVRTVTMIQSVPDPDQMLDYVLQNTTTDYSLTRYKRHRAYKWRQSDSDGRSFTHYLYKAYSPLFQRECVFLSITK